MSLGVLNNLNAVYAENNLNNTSNSLSKVLNQLSSGSKINSGADDAAGLSLVDGLQANSMALQQSATNATEGVGLLTVADGALSQVTNLLNRAVTLATEASNGTLNGSQDTAANQEYQSILSEISNIGSTTTYNQQSVFGTSTNIYTGDSSTTGASIDDLNIRSLSSANVGDTGGVMSYSTGSSGNNVFIDLSNTPGSSPAVATSEASLGDTLNSTGTTSVTINTLSSTGTVVANSITVGGTSGFSNTAQGLISAINNSGLGVTASFTTAAVAGDPTSTTTKVSATDTGIMISGSVGAGSSPSASSFSGVVAAAGNTSSAGTSTKAGSDIMSGSITLQVGNNVASTVTAAQVATSNSEASGAVTMSQLASYITANAGLGVTATVDSATGALDLSTTGSTSALKVSSNLTDNTLTTGSAGNETTSYTATGAYSAGVLTGAYSTTGVTDSNIDQGAALTKTAGTAAAYSSGAGTSGVVASIAEANTSSILKGTLTMADGAGTALTDTGLSSISAGVITLGVSGQTDTLTNLAATINAALTSMSDQTYETADINSTSGALEINLTSAGAGKSTWTTLPTASLNATATGSTKLTQGSTADSFVNGSASTTGGTATISYSDKAGTSLSGTDLSNQTDAQTALSTLNTAITAVAAQDGYLGAQINTLNAVSQVLSTQSQNVTAAQNAVQATDYASATSNMSKYEILSQTGISALAQANSMQQEVTKLLQ